MRPPTTLQQILIGIAIGVLSGVVSAYATAPMTLARYAEKFDAIEKWIVTHQIQQQEDMRELKSNIRDIHQCLINRTCR